MAGAGITGYLGTTVEVSEIESLANGSIIIGDGSGAPTTRAAFASSTGALTTLLATAGGTVTASTPFWDAVQTWNAAGTTFIGARIVITDTASAAGSLALQILGGAAGATNLLSVSKGGAVTAGGDITAVFGNIAADTTYSLTWTGRSRVYSPADGVILLQNNASTDFSRLQFGGTTNAFPALKRSTTGLIVRLADDSADAPLTASTVTPSAPAITAGTGTGLTVVNTGEVRRVVYKVTVTYAALAAAGLTADKTIATLPAKTNLVGIYADTTTKYIGGAVSAASMIVGTSAGASDLLATHDVFTAAITRGLADADLGTAMVRAAAIQTGYMPSWTGTTIVSVRLTTVTANTDQLTQGSTTFYLVTEEMP